MLQEVGLGLEFASTIPIRLRDILLVDPSGRRRTLASAHSDLASHILSRIARSLALAIDCSAKSRAGAGHLLQDGRPGLRHPLASARLFVQSAIASATTCTAVSAVLECHCRLEIIFALYQMNSAYGQNMPWSSPSTPSPILQNEVTSQVKTQPIDPSYGR
ncbi:hypothetical protein NA56DRAFT_712206 [Hyaloscypha hepaticicola]|uniref:Uncharacterized protein n=1 Tax=Hyaloscypha hepaticicola TaxID=2082293 RepID=A0A2J6PGY0_9HELO|nr:hypothetical protein NA56DRAFT_712206 [Hyaloscypha hepaticicola]